MGLWNTLKKGSCAGLSAGHAAVFFSRRVLIAAFV
jgi:hypothetical protein